MMIKNLFFIAFALITGAAFAQTPCDVSIEITDLTGALGIPAYQFDAIPPSNTASTTYNWTWDQGGTGTGNSVYATFNFTGTISICVEVNDTYYNCNNTVCDSLTIGGNLQSCDAGFTTNIQANNTVAFVGNMSYLNIPNLQFEWDLGDGVTSTNPLVSHTYTNPGLYTVCCTVNIPNDCTDTFCYDVVVYDNYVPPSDSCTTSFDYQQSAIGEVLLTGESSVNPNSTFLIEYVWSYAGLTQTGNPVEIPASLLNDSLFVCLNTYAYSFYGDTCIAEICDYVLSNNNTNNCDASFEYSETAYPLTYLFLADQSPNIVQYYFWDFGDGNTASSTFDAANTYAAPGIYTVCLTIETFDNCTSTTCTDVEITDGYEPPNDCETLFTYNFTSSDSLTFYGWVDGDTLDIASIDYTWDVSGLPIDFNQSFSIFVDDNTSPGFPLCLTTTITYLDGTVCTSSSCDDIDLTNNPYSCPIAFNMEADPMDSLTYSFAAEYINPNTLQSIEWDFGDGNSSTEISPTHTYVVADSAIVCVTISSINTFTGIVCTNTTCLPIFVDTNVPTPPSIDDCSAYYIYNGNTNSGAVGFTPILSLFNFNTEYFWDFGDGTTDTISTPFHMFPADGMYNVCLTITNDSCSTTYCEWIEVEVFTDGFAISGNVSLTGDDYAIVYLVEFNETDSTLTAVQVSLAQDLNGSNGFYSFYNLENGDYLIKAALIPGSENYWEYLPTYYGDVELWHDANFVTINNNFADDIDINLIAGQNTGGPGFIGGLISEGAGKVALDGIPELEVILYNELQQPVQYTYTDEEGNYSFSNLAYGTYWVTADQYGLDFPMVEVLLGEENEIQNSIDMSSGVTDIISYLHDVQLDNSFQIFPNPNNGSFTLSVDFNFDYDIEIIDLNGKVVYKATSNNKETFVDTNLEEGLYMVNVIDDNKIIHIQHLYIVK